MQNIIQDVQNNGFALIKCISDELIEEILDEYKALEHHFIEIQKRQCIYSKVINTTHHTPIICRKMLKLLEPSLLTEFLEYFFEVKNIYLILWDCQKLNPWLSLYTKNT